MYCHNCGQRLADTARFCPSCGEPVSETRAEEYGAPAHAPEAEEHEAAGYDRAAGMPGETRGGEWEYVNGADAGRGIYDRNDGAMNERLRQDREARVPKGRAVASLVLGIISLVLVWVPVVPVVLALIGLILGGSARRKGERGLSTAGITLGVLGLVFGALISFLWIFLILNVMGIISISGFPGLSGLPGLSEFGDLGDLGNININIPIGKNIRVAADLPALIGRIVRQFI